MLHTAHRLAPATTCPSVCNNGRIHVPADKEEFTRRFKGLPLKYVTRIRAAWAIQACIHNDLTSDRDVPCPHCETVAKHKNRA